MTTATAATATEARPPHTLLALTEPTRAMGEFASFLALRPLLKRLPKGDGHGVLVLPGFMASDTSTRPLRATSLASVSSKVSWVRDPRS